MYHARMNKLAINTAHIEGIVKLNHTVISVDNVHWNNDSVSPAQCCIFICWNMTIWTETYQPNKINPNYRNYQYNGFRFSDINTAVNSHQYYRKHTLKILHSKYIHCHGCFTSLKSPKYCIHVCSQSGDSNNLFENDSKCFITI